LSSIKRVVRNWIGVFPDPRSFFNLLRLPRFLMAWRSYAARSDESVRFADLYPCLNDATSHTPFDAHYVFQGAWLARRLEAWRPQLHVDIGSSIQTVSAVSAFVPTLFLDYRPVVASLPNLASVGGTITQLPFADRSVASLSCLHVIEHIGLGRYGDPVDVQGSRKAIGELARVLAVGGRLFLSVPIGRSRVCFNAHRVFDPREIVSYFAGLRLASFAYVNDAGALIPEARPEEVPELDYGCGFFEFERPALA
jgi:hypothetical protein